MKIPITQHHIDVGIRGSCSSDPIALAMLAMGLERPHVGPTYLTWRKNFKDYSVPTPEEVLEFMQTFDNRPEAARPISFEINE